MQECGTNNCTNAAFWTVFWPGQTIVMCHDCKKRAEGIAEAMGLVLDCRPTAIAGGINPNIQGPQ